MNWLRNKKNIALILSIVLLLTCAVGTTFGYIVTQAPALMNLFIPGYDSTGDLIIKKSVEHPFGGDYVVPDDIEFTFDVSLGTDYASKSVLSSLGLLNCDENGNVVVSLKPGSLIELNEIKTGTVVNVTERLDRAGFSVNQVSQSVTIGRFNDSVIEYTNIYSPSNAVPNVSVNVNKVISGRDWLESDSFVFRLDMQLYGDSDWIILGEKTVSHDINTPELHMFELTDLIQSVSFDTVGTYVFRLSEVGGTISGMTSEVKSFDIKVTDIDMDGYLEISEVKSEGNSVEMVDNHYHLDLTVVNEYLPEGSDEVEILITKVLNDLSGQNKTPDGFSFSLYDETGTFIKSSSVTSSTGETSIKMNYSAENAGNTYTYVLKEDKGLINGMIYDEKEVKISVTVTDNYDGTVSAVIYEYVEPVVENIPEVTETPELTPEPTPEPVNLVPEGASDVLNISFVNTYDPVDASVVLSGNKLLEGRELNAGEFKFDLICEGTVIESVSHDENGFFEFSALTFDKVGTTVYSVKENTDSLAGGISPDTSVYTVSVSVSDNNGVLVSNVKITDETGNDSELKFINDYHAEKTSVMLSGHKNYLGAELEPEDFMFDLIQTDENYALNDVALQSVSNHESGDFTFESLVFDTCGTYYYVIKENSSHPKNGVTYDTSEVHVMISVIDDKNGHLFTEIDMKKVNGNTETNVEEIVFENSYDAKDAVLSISGLKILEGAALHEGVFTFKLIETDENYVYDDSSIVKSTVNGADGTFVFDALTYSEAEPHYYVVFEDTSNPVDRVEYDQRVVKLKVDVKDVDGQLVCEVEGMDQLVFKNSYIPEASDISVNITAHKHVNNTGTESIGPEGFEFVLENLDTNVKSIMKSDASGNAIFTLTFTEADAGKTFNYKLSEVNTGLEYVTYSTSAVRMSIEIVMTEDHQLKAVLKQEGTDVESLHSEFVNIYHHVIDPEPTPTPTPIPEIPADTSDRSNITLYVWMMVLSALIMILMIVLRRRMMKK